MAQDSAQIEFHKEKKESLLTVRANQNAIFLVPA